MKKWGFLFPALLLLLNSCGTSKKAAQPETNVPVIALDTVVATLPDSTLPLYRAAETRINDIIHTKLDVRFDWTNAHLLGKATLTVKPYFYPVRELQLDARGFDIHEVALLHHGVKSAVTHTYRDNVIFIPLDKEYTRLDTFQVYIDYTAKPNTLKTGGSNAISSDKGLYFINPDGKEKNKPRQIWTQGETQSNSAWFPTIDRPNERMTHDIYITVDKNFVTLSNGELNFSTENTDGTRTDHWKMDLPHAPYLVMMAIGEFAVVKDKWRDKEINYYVEKEYAPHARAIFGNTPEMLEFFSRKLDVPYPWNKYSQVVVRDYVSGAMENTTATIHGEFLQRTTRELLDETNEDIIAHEAFHQWFGDLVTCESWSNLPLNESFATYGEYLWDEYKYGRDAADFKSQQSLEGYLQEAKQKRVNMIRFHYDNREDMFDAHSYNKGGRVLHMLRKYTGDEAFYAALKLYLEKNKFTAVEMHQLRLAFEQVTGEDLNWFFNQWFFSSGHPEMVISHFYDDSLKTYTVTISQTQDLKESPLFQLPLLIDIYANGKTERHKVVVKKSKEAFVFPLTSRPDLVNVDAEKMLLCDKVETKSPQALAFQYYHAPLFLDRYEALIDLFTDKKEDPLIAEVNLDALNDKFWYLRALAIANLKSILPGKEKEIKERLVKLAQKDDKSFVRASALRFLATNYREADLIPLLTEALKDSSYAVVGIALSGIAQQNPQEGLNYARAYENESSNEVMIAIAEMYAEHGKDEHHAFFIQAFDKLRGYSRYGFITHYTRYLKQASDTVINEALPLLEKVARDKSSKWYRYYGQKAIKDIMDMYSEREKKVAEKLETIKTAEGNNELLAMKTSLEKTKAQKQKLRELYQSVTETK